MKSIHSSSVLSFLTMLVISLFLAANAIVEKEYIELLNISGALLATLSFCVEGDAVAPQHVKRTTLLFISFLLISARLSLAIALRGGIEPAMFFVLSILDALIFYFFITSLDEVASKSH